MKTLERSTEIILALLLLVCMALISNLPMSKANRSIWMGTSQSTDYALSFDGQDDIVKVPDSDSLDLRDAGTIEAWIKHPGNWGVHTIISKASMTGNNMGYNNYCMDVANGDQLSVSIGAGNGISDWIAVDNVVPTNVWIHVAFSWDGTILKLYKNGVEIGSKSQTITPTINDKPLFIGKESSSMPSGYFFQGLIDEVRIWRIARNQKEIQNSMNTPLIGTENGLVAYWRFDEGSGQKALDATANHNDGQLGSTSGSDNDDPTWALSDRTGLNTYAYTDKSLYVLGENVTLTFQNIGSTTITLSNTAPWVILDALGRIVFSPIGLQMLVYVSPGQILSWVWNTGKQLQSGIYTFRIATSAGTFTATFRVVTEILYGSTYSPIGLITIDTTTGAGSFIGQFGTQNAVWGLEYDSKDNTLYGVTNDATDIWGNSQLLKINRVTGTATPVGGLVGHRIEGLAYDSINDKLYGVEYIYPGNIPNNLVVIDTTTGKGTVIGSLGLQNLEGLAFSPFDGKLYSVDVSSGALIRIAPSTGIGTVVAQISSGWEQIRGLSFDLVGKLYGAYQPSDGSSTHLVIIDISTGQITDIGLTGYSSVEGLAFVYRAIDRYAILAAPVRQESEAEFKHNIDQMRKILLSSGWTDNNIIFLTPSNLAKQATNEPWIDGDATYENVGKALDAIAFGGTYSFRQTGGSLGPPQSFIASGPNDIVFIELRDHGGQVTDGWRPTGVAPDPNPNDEADRMDGVFCTYEWNNPAWNPANYWYDDEFALKLNNFQCSKLVLMVDACHSGEFIPECSGNGRLIVTSCAEGQTSYRTAYVFYQRIVNLAADGYGGYKIDGMISVQEAHYYAVSQVIQYQAPQISDQIGGEFYLDPPNLDGHSGVEAEQRAQNQHQTSIDPSHVLINEFFYNYANLQEPLQWVEIYNPTGTSIDLSGWVLAFDSIDGINLFPPGIIIGPGQYLIVTHNSNALREEYTIPPGVRVIDDDEMGNNLGALPTDTLRLYDDTHFKVVDHLDYGGGPGRAPAVAPPNSIARYKGGFDTNNSENDWYVETKPTPGSENPQVYTHALVGDVDGNGKVDLTDVFKVARAFGTKPGDENWNVIADVDKNGIVNLKDVFLVAKDFGKTT